MRQQFTREKRFVDVYYDDEINPPIWMVRIGIKVNGKLLVEDVIGAKSREEARRIKQRLLRERKHPLLFKKGGTSRR